MESSTLLSEYSYSQGYICYPRQLHPPFVDKVCAFVWGGILFLCLPIARFDRRMLGLSDS